MKIEILGTGCAKCEKLADTAETAARQLGIDYELVKVKDLAEISRRGVMFTPAMAIDGDVKISGKVPDQAEMTTILTSGIG